MKKTLLLTMALGLASAASLTAQTVEVFLTGSTAFRANCYNAALNLFSTTPTIYYGDAAHGGADSGWSSSTASWVMTGNPVSTLTNIQGSTLVVHGLFTGSIQGIQTVESKTKLIFPKPAGTANQLTSGYVTNAPTIGFSDSASDACPYPSEQFGCTEEKVAVQPFVFLKSLAGGSMNSISNVTYEQLRYGLDPGRIPLSAWTGVQSDTNTFIYVVERTSDSGTRRTETACMGYSYGQTVGIYIWNETNKVWYPGTNTSVIAASGNGTNGVVGPAGLNNANLNWGAGYVGGGDLRDHALADANANNLSLGCLSFNDASKNLGVGAWGTAIPFNGIWPTTAGIGLHGHSGTNDFSPITQGYYPLWAEEVIVYPSDIDNFGADDNKINTFQLGSANDPGSFVWVFNYQTKSNPGHAVLPGSIEKTIEDSKVGGATAIRLSDMRANRNDVGGKIIPY